MKCAIIMDNGFEELEAMGPIALLRRGGVDVDLVSVHDDHVTGRFGVTYSKTTPMKDYDFDAIDCLIIPGGAHAKKLEANPDVLELIKKVANDDSKVLAAICAAPTILGKLGLLKGKEYTCFKSMNEDFGSNYHYQYVVEDGNLITGISASAAEEFGFAILEKLTGKEHTDEVKASIYYDAAH